MTLRHIQWFIGFYCKGTEICKMPDASVNSFSGETELVIQTCVTCSKPFRAYVPDTSCIMPDGIAFSYCDAQTEFN